MPPMALCVSRDGKQLFITDRDNGRVHVKRVSDGSHVRSMCGDNTPATSHHCLARYPSGICVSASGDDVIVADPNRSRLVVFRVADGALVRTIGSSAVSGDCYIGHVSGPFALCVSACGTWLFFSIEGSFLYVVRASDGVLVSTLSTGAYSMCVSPKTHELVCRGRSEAGEHVLSFYSCG